jgi:alkanesulfonate monooxygenase SsuD/methylene tetrahydromethanopterin reductase-like flavin-dependent oxidoreductase (luciferase family)
MPAQQVLSYVDHARDLGFRYLAAHDHVVHPRPWIDGPTMLPAVIPRLDSMVPMTAVWLPVVRGPLATARGLTALDQLSGGRLIAGLGAGSSEADFETAGIRFEERWQRFDESVSFLRAVWREGATFEGRFYSAKGVVLEPQPARRGGPPLWLGTWGSKAGLRRTARSADGWIASAYNTTPRQFGEAWQRLCEILPEHGKDPQTFPNALATVALFISQDRASADRMLRDVLGPILHRAPEDLAESLLIGPPEVCAELIGDYANAGVQRLLLMPVIDEFEQLTLFREQVMPLL